MCPNLIFRGSVADLQFDLFVLYFTKSVTVIELNQSQAKTSVIHLLFHNNTIWVHSKVMMDYIQVEFRSIL